MFCAGKYTDMCGLCQVARSVISLILVFNIKYRAPLKIRIRVPPAVNGNSRGDEKESPAEEKSRLLRVVAGLLPGAFFSGGTS